MLVMRRIIHLMVVSVLMIGVASSYSATQSLDDIQFLKRTNEWQLFFSLSGQSTPLYRSFTLTDPDRLVVDLFNTTQNTTVPSLPFQQTPIKQLRVAYHTPKTLRVVMDLSRPLQSQVDSSLVNGHQELQVKLYDGSKQPLTPSPATATKPTPAVAAPPKSVALDDKLDRPSQVIVVIDPGHGGKDPGATGVRGTHEKDVVLSISKKLYRLINDQPGFKAYLTRDSDYYLTLRQRLALARKYRADMFVAIHADAFHNKSAKGVSVFALSSKGATSEAARWLAEKENQSELIGGVELSDKNHMLQSVLIDLSQAATIRSSLQVGSTIIDSLQKFATMHDHKVDQAAFVVLKSPDIPSLLIETGFLSNPDEELRLRTDSYRQQVARAIQHGIVGYFTAQPPRGTTLARNQANAHDTFTHKVKRGDTLSAIALRYHVTVAQLRVANHLSSDHIHVGQVLNIPQRQA